MPPGYLSGRPTQETNMTRKEAAVPAADERMPTVAGGFRTADHLADGEASDPDETVGVEYEGRAQPGAGAAERGADAPGRLHPQDPGTGAAGARALEAVHENLVHGDKLQRFALARPADAGTSNSRLSAKCNSARSPPRDPRTPVLLRHVAKLEAGARSGRRAPSRITSSTWLSVFKRARAKRDRGGRWARLQQDVEGWSPEGEAQRIVAGRQGAWFFRWGDSFRHRPSHDSGAQQGAALRRNPSPCGSKRPERDGYGETGRGRGGRGARRFRDPARLSTAEIGCAGAPTNFAKRK